MKIRKIIFISLVNALTLVMSSCKEPEVPNLDKQITIAFNRAVWTTLSTNWDMTPRYTHLIKFNKANYSNLTSIVFIATLGVQNGDTNNQCYVKLYNVTDGEDITTTDLNSTSRTLEWKESENIIDKLPAKEIDIAIMIRSSNGSGWVEVNTPSLVLYRD